MDNGQYFMLPTEVVDSLKCTECQLYLSCAPITRQKNTQNTICGRCPTPVDGIPELVLEKVLAKFAFPCSFDDKGCIERVLFNNVTEHESNCEYRTVQCPIANCLQISSENLFKQHFHDHHYDLIMRNGSRLELYKENLVSYIMIVENDVVAVFDYSYDSNKKLLIVKAGYVSKNDDQIVKYKIQLLKPNGLTSNLFYDQCNVYKYPMKHEVAVSLGSYLFDCADEFDICIKVKIKRDQKRKPLQPLLPVSKFMKDDDEIEAKANYLMSKLNDIICAKCQDIIIPPIHEVTNNKTLCCGNCVSEYISGGYTITKVEKTINDFPCKWKGCSVICTDMTIREHVETCKFLTHICLFCKPEIDFLMKKDSMWGHLQEHAVFCSNPNNIRIDLFNPDNKIETNRYFTIFENKILYFTCNLLDKKLWKFGWQFQKGIQVCVSFEHDHCRHRFNVVKPYKIDHTITPTSFKFPGCFSSYNRLRIILKVESYTL